MALNLNIPDDSFQAARTITLPSGRTAALRQGKGRDLMNATRMAGAGADGTAVTYALVAQLVQIDGKAISYEEILDMDLADVLALQAEVAGSQNFPAPAQTPAPSQPSSGSDSPQAS